MNKKILGIALVLFTLVFISSVFADETAEVSFNEESVYVRNPNPKTVRVGNRNVPGPNVSGQVCITIEHLESRSIRTQDEPYDVKPGERDRVYRLRSNLVEEGWKITGASITTCFVIPNSN